MKRNHYSRGFWRVVESREPRRARTLRQAQGRLPVAPFAMGQGDSRECRRQKLSCLDEQKHRLLDFDSLRVVFWGHHSELGRKDATSGRSYFGRSGSPRLPSPLFSSRVAGLASSESQRVRISPTYRRSLRPARRKFPPAPSLSSQGAAGSLGAQHAGRIGPVHHRKVRRAD